MKVTSSTIAALPPHSGRSTLCAQCNDTGGVAGDDLDLEKMAFQISSGLDRVGPGECHRRQEGEWDDRYAVQRCMLWDVCEVPDGKLRQGGRVTRTLSPTEPWQEGSETTPGRRGRAAARVQGLREGCYAPPLATERVITDVANTGRAAAGLPDEEGVSRPLAAELLVPRNGTASGTTMRASIWKKVEEFVNAAVGTLGLIDTEFDNGMMQYNDRKV